MRAVVCNELGPIENLVVEERPSAPLGPRDVRVAVAACGVNYVEGLIVQGLYQIKPPTPFVPGMEVVGRIVEIGPEVTTRQVGDRVFANVMIGGYVSESVIHEARTLVLPDSLSDGQAATFMQSYMTGMFALRERTGVREGETMLVLGAGGGVGLAAVDLGVALGLRVIAAASSAEKRDLARSLGAEEVIDSGGDASPDDVKEAAKAWAASVGNPTGLDVLYDPVGGALGETCLRALGERGRYVVIGFVGGIPHLPANQILLRNRTVVGVDWGAWAGRHAAENHAMLGDVLDLIAAGRLHPVEPTTYPLEEAARALADLAERRVAGKVALIP